MVTWEVLKTMYPGRWNTKWWGGKKYTRSNSVDLWPTALENTGWLMLLGGSPATFYMLARKSPKRVREQEREKVFFRWGVSESEMCNTDNWRQSRREREKEREREREREQQVCGEAGRETLWSALDLKISLEGKERERKKCKTTTTLRRLLQLPNSTTHISSRVTLLPKLPKQ